MQWHPQALSTLEDGSERGPERLSFATASADRTAKMWNMAGACLQTLTGHTGRLARTAFHPTGASVCIVDGMCTAHQRHATQPMLPCRRHICHRELRRHLAAVGRGDRGVSGRTGRPQSGSLCNRVSSRRLAMRIGGL